MHLYILIRIFTWGILCKKDAKFLHADNEGCAQTVQADLCLCLVYMLESIFSCAAVHMFEWQKPHQGPVVQNVTKLLAKMTLKFLS